MYTVIIIMQMIKNKNVPFHFLEFFLLEFSLTSLTLTCSCHSTTGFEAIKLLVQKYWPSLTKMYPYYACWYT